jgi:hypothetical protein
MSLFDPATVAVELALGVVGGLVSTGVYLVYQRWVTEYARWPFAVAHRETIDPSVPGNFTAKVSIRNRTATSTQFLINFRLSNGELCIPRACCEEEARNRTDGWGSIPPGDSREFEFYPDIHALPIVGVKLVAKAPSQRECREFDYTFERTFEPLDSLDGVPGCA